MPTVSITIGATDKADAVHQLLPKVAERYSATLGSSEGRIGVSIAESWGPFGPHDWFKVHNGGPPLEDCTIVVELIGAKGEIRKNVHFVDHWPSNSMLYARYDAGKNVNGRIVNRETVYGIQKAELTIFSPQFSTKGTYVYQGINKDKHIAMICEDIKITGRYQPFEKGIVWNTERGAKFWLDGVGFIPKCQVTLTFRKGSESRSWDWNFDSWRKGEEKSFDTPVGQLTFDPDYIDMLISFPETSYKHDVDLTIKK